MPVTVGVPHLERLLAPVPEHATLLYLNDPGVEAEPFVYQAAHAHLATGGEVVYAVTNRSPTTVLKAMRDVGFEAGDHARRLHFLDAFSCLMGMGTEARYAAQRGGDVDEVATLLERASRENPHALLVVDTLSQLIDQGSSERFLATYPRLAVAMRRFAQCQAIFTRWPYAAPVEAVLADFDAVVTLKGVEDRVMLSQYFRVERAAWRPELETKPLLYKTLKPGGVHVYVPKIVVTGPYNAGKSSFVHAISDTAVSADQLGTTVALDHGRVTMDGLTADIFGTPGQARFDPILRIVAGQALGVIVVVDSTKPDSFARAKEMLTLTWRQGLPGIIAANKQDLPGALAPDEVAKLISPPPTVKVVGCSGQDRSSGRRVLQELLDQILTTPEVAR